MARRYRIEKNHLLGGSRVNTIRGYLLIYLCSYWQRVKVWRSSHLYFIQLPNAGGWLSERTEFLQVGQILVELTAGRDLLTVPSTAGWEVLPGRW